MSSETTGIDLNSHLKSIENPIIFCKAAEYSFTILLCSINTDLASFQKSLTVFYSPIRQNTFAYCFVISRRVERDCLPGYLIHMVYVILGIIHQIVFESDS